MTLEQLRHTNWIFAFIRFVLHFWPSCNFLLRVCMCAFRAAVEAKEVYHMKMPVVSDNRLSLLTNMNLVFSIKGLTYVIASQWKIYVEY